MKRMAVAGGIAAVSVLFLSAPAQADPSVCLDVQVDVNGQGTAQSICLPQG